MITEFGAGDRAGGYRLLRLLGGGMSSVFEAVRLADDQRVALKLMRSDAFANDAALRRRFQREVAALRAVSHPSLPELIDAGEVDGIPYLATRFIDGESLAAHVERRLASGLTGPIDAGLGGVAGLCDLFAAIAEALHALHQAGFVHRDVKPANVLVAPDGRAFLLDFGLVLVEDESAQRLTRTGHVVGTPVLLAPEQLDPSRGRIGPWTDVHGLAATLYACLTLRHPFAAPSLSAVLHRILHDEPQEPKIYAPALSIHIVGLLRRAFAKDPARRHGSAAAFAADLRRVAAGRAPARAPFRPIAALRDHLRRATFAACAVAIVAALTLMLSGDAADDFGTTGALSDARAIAKRIPDTMARLESLDPPWPDNESELSAAIADAEGLIAGRLVIENTFAASDPGERELLDRSLTDLRDMETNIVPAALDRRSKARSVHSRSGVDGNLVAWRKAAAWIAADPRFADFKLAPQPALAPLGTDPGSGLCEFHDLASAVPSLADPVRDASGRLQLMPEHGMVMILVPAPAPGQQPFLIGKHEVTRAQWLRLVGNADPSQFPTGYDDGHGAIGPMHPVDRVAWVEAVRELGRWGLALPTAEQWLSAAAAGGSPTDAAAGTLAARANIVDRSFVRVMHRAFEPDNDDGYVLTAPIGTFAPNAFGLHDTLGNLWEWTAEQQGLALSSTAIARGGSYGTEPRDCRTDYRFSSLTDQQLDEVGLRAAREVRIAAPRGPR